MDRSDSISRLRLSIRGAVQGVGFRPFIYRLATSLGLCGWVSNSQQGVFVEVEGPVATLRTFLLRVESEKPPRSSVQSLESSWLDTVGYTGFEIRPSDSSGPKAAFVLPDIATCPDCLREILEPANRRFFYPFTNCTNCGPRFSIIEALPYDRPNTSMKKFTMCPECQAEYDDPANRRFHAQPNACPRCGPRLALWDGKGNPVALPVAPAGTPEAQVILSRVAAALRGGEVVAVKGIGGFHLMVDAQKPTAVQRLRELKHREEKPFAVMFPSLEAVKAACAVSPLEARLLLSPEAPIVLLRRRHDARACPCEVIAPGNPYVGALLPYSPLHHLLMSMVAAPVVATSGNLSDEPICTDEHEALDRLARIADLFLVHDRPIVRHVDDSIARIIMDRELVLRRARGYAPLPVRIRISAPDGKNPPVLAVGAHLKNTVALSVENQVFISQHIGDLETVQAFEAFRRVSSDLQKLYDVQPALVAADAHPDYFSTQFARQIEERSCGSDPTDPRLITVQHHLAHVFSCMAENELEPPFLGVSWDGTGYGLDGTVWGGEFFLVSREGWQRVAHFRTFRLPGGDQAVKEPRRSALGLLFELRGDSVFRQQDGLPPVRAFPLADLSVIRSMLARGLNSPFTSSAGRLFDAVASLIGLRQSVRFEGQAAMELEFAASGTESEASYAIKLVSSESGGDLSESHRPVVLDWGPLIEAVLADLSRGTPRGEIAAAFHNALVEAILAVARKFALQAVLLSGGCFQNRYLTERAVQRLRQEGFRPYWHQRVPPNDGGISLGQVVAALRRNV